MLKARKLATKQPLTVRHKVTAINPLAINLHMISDTAILLAIKAVMATVNIQMTAVAIAKLIRGQTARLMSPAARMQ